MKREKMIKHSRPPSGFLDEGLKFFFFNARRYQSN